MADRFEDLKRLTEMRDAGDITADEYERLKTELMAEQGSAPAPQAEGTSAPEPIKSASSAPEMEAQTRWWLIGTGLLIAVGSLLPWAQSGIFSAAGTQGDGVFTLIGGVVIALVGVANRASRAAGLVTVLLAGFSVFIVANVYGNLAGVNGGIRGSGLYLTGLASVFAAIAGLKVFTSARA